MPRSTSGTPENLPPGHPLVLNVGNEQVTISNFRAELPESAAPKDRVSFVRTALRHNLALDEDALHAAARALVDPRTAMRAVDNDLLVQEIVGPAKLRIAQLQAYLPELLVLLQPRAGAAARIVEPPRVVGGVAADEDDPEIVYPDAMLVIRFKDEEHLKAQVVQTVLQTLKLGRDYSSSILTKRVSRPVLAHVVRIEFDDGESFDVTVVRDGITRVVSSWRTIFPELSADELADKMVSILLASKRSRRSEDTETAARARGRDEHQQKLRQQFALGMATGYPTEEAMRIGQAFILPVQMVVDFYMEGPATVPVEQQFDDAIQALIGSVHNEFQAWEQSASDAVSVLRALPRAVHDGELDAAVAQIAAGQLTVDDVPKVFGEDVPPEALWRAVYLVAAMCSPTAFDGIKKHMRELLGVLRISRRAYVSHLMTLVDLPWRSAKGHTEQQARRAWRNGGPVPHDLLGTNWTPVPTEDFITLIPLAEGGDENARATLQVAGGIALVADKLLMSNTGSAVSVGEVPFRSDVNEVVAKLGHSTAGLWLLARAANAFDPTKKAINSFTPKEILEGAVGEYVVPGIDAKKPDTVPLDNAGQPARLTPYRVVSLSDPARAAEMENIKKESEDKKKAAGAQTNQEKAQRLRKTLKQSLETALNSLETLVSLGDFDSSLVPIFVDETTWSPLEVSARKISGKLFNLEPPRKSTLAGESPDDEDPEDEYEDGEQLL